MTDVINKSESIQWLDYLKVLDKEWNELLNNKVIKEKKIQNFFENNPCMLPGATGIINPSGHYPFPGALISQPPLPNFTRKIPDFMWISIDSGNIRPVLVEIELPTKRWFNKNSTPTSDFTKAQKQLNEWRIWFGDSYNDQKFKEYYKLPFNLYDKKIKPFYVLIFGRRYEFDDNNEFNQLRQAMKKEDEEFMTFDRLKPQKDIAELMCVRLKKSGYVTVAIPPTFRIIIEIKDYLKLIKNKSEAVKNNLFLEDERKEFLIERLKYWDDYKENTIRMYPGGYSE